MTAIDSTAARPMATPGFGKRLIPNQPRTRKRDFADLPDREAYLATLIDGLPEGALMDIKSLANAQTR